jgi:H+-transporting ATPase
VDVSALTGESNAIDKTVDDEVLGGSIVRRGEATTTVIRTGRNTKHGLAMELVSTSAPKMHIEAVISKVVWTLLVLVIIMIIIVLLVALLANGYTFIRILPLLLVLLVSAVPVALPVMFSIVTALGSLELSHKNVLITRLSCTEDVASMSVLCSDKTGTLSKNQMALTDRQPLWDEEMRLHYMPAGEQTMTGDDLLVLLGCLASKEENKDVIDMAFFEVANKNEAVGERLRDGSYRQLSFIPFSRETKRTEGVALHVASGRRFRIAKGAVDETLELCGLQKDDPMNERARSFAESFGEQGRKSMLIAIAEIPSRGSKKLALKNADVNNDAPASALHFELVGILAISDPPREDSLETVRQLQDLGVVVKMLTGDAQPIGKDMAGRVGIGDRVMSMRRLRETQGVTTNDMLVLDMNSIDGLAEVLPEDKHWVVKQLQKQDFVVGSK